jgi:hypothetical protein
MKLKLESKFIKDTDKQYSIREDGAVISHYRFNYWSSENKNYKNTTEKVLKPIDGRYNIFVNNKQQSYSKIKLVYEYFGWHICRQCKCKHTGGHGFCKECRNKNIVIRYKNRYKNNIEKYREKGKIYTALNIKNISKCYVSDILNIPSKDLTNELYNEYKNLLFYKREIAKKHKINIYSIK